MTNYRGISLMSVAVKVLLAILAARLHEGAVGGDAPRLHMIQGGFVRRGESAAQVASLYDILRRRWRQNQRTHAVFLDWKQAYDQCRTACCCTQLHTAPVRRARPPVRGDKDVVLAVTCNLAGRVARRARVGGVRVCLFCAPRGAQLRSIHPPAALNSLGDTLPPRANASRRRPAPAFAACREGDAYE